MDGQVQQAPGMSLKQAEQELQALIDTLPEDGGAKRSQVINGHNVCVYRTHFGTVSSLVDIGGSPIKPATPQSLSPIGGQHEYSTAKGSLHARAEPFSLPLFIEAHAHPPKAALSRRIHGGKTGASMQRLHALCAPRRVCSQIPRSHEMSNQAQQQVRFVAQQVGGQGWTVVKRVGSKRTGREEFATDASTTLTMHQAQATADAMQRDFNRGAA